MASQPDLATLTAETFEPHVGSVFTIVAGEDRREIRLDRVEAKPQLMEGATNPDGTPFYKRTPFVLTFSGPAAELFGQSTFEVHHEVLGVMPLFIKPFAEDGTTSYYESFFT
ncbi:MAG: hypothetical protein HKN82_17565 [Akkermansiaceae bacterium]|nr:hypothetical protein [Akkermansiaceae bacterium]NNM28152.1 hypothetical protein [Akkermansiaceae bacterium]